MSDPKKYSRIADAIFSKPWLISDEYANLFQQIILERLDGQIRTFAPRESTKEEWTIQNNVGIIPVMGPISKRMNLFSEISGGTSTDVISSQLREAVVSPKTKAVLLKIESPGGTVMGVPELGSEIFKLRKQTNKPIVAYADGLAASAAYWIGSQADEFYASEAAEVGSIGVYARFISYDRMMKNEGADPVVIRSSELKGIGADSLTPNQEQALKKSVMKTYDQFKAAVSRSRPQVDMEKAASGLTWSGQDAIDLGLIDDTCTMDELISKLGGKNPIA